MSEVRIGFWVALVFTLVLGGWYLHSRMDDRAKLKQAEHTITATQDQAADNDQATQDKLRHDARVDAGVGVASTKRRELKSHDASYRDYLDRPLPDGSLRLYRDAAARFRAAEHPDPDGANPGGDQVAR